MDLLHTDSLQVSPTDTWTQLLAKMGAWPAGRMDRQDFRANHCPTETLVLEFPENEVHKLRMSIQPSVQCVLRELQKLLHTCVKT